MNILITISIILFSVSIITVFMIIFAMLKTASDYYDASDEIYRNKLIYRTQLQQISENEKIEKHKQMMEDANMNSEIIDTPPQNRN